MRICRAGFARIILTGVFSTALLLCLHAKSSPAAIPRASGLTDVAQRQFESGNYAQAISTLQEAVALSPSDAAAYYWLGRCYYEMQDYDNAVAQAQKSISLDPKNSVYHDWLGRAFGGKADKERSFFTARKVKGQFETAVELDPKNITARRDLLEYCIEAPSIVGGNKDEAAAQVTAIAELDPVEGHLARAVFDLEALKKPDLADAEYRQVLDAKPNRIEPYLEAAAFWVSQDKPVDATAAIDAAAKIAPSDPRITYYRGAIGALSGANLGEAETLLKSYLASTPDRSDWPSHASARYWLGRLYEAEGKRAEAAEQYRAALQLDPGRKDIQARLAALEKTSH